MEGDERKMRQMVVRCFVLAVDHRGSESVIDNNLDSALLATSVRNSTDADH